MKIGTSTLMDSKDDIKRSQMLIPQTYLTHVELDRSKLDDVLFQFKGLIRGIYKSQQVIKILKLTRCLKEN